MELQYIVLTIIKILISVPTITIVLQLKPAEAAALIGGYVTKEHTAPKSNISEFKIDLSEDVIQEETLADKLVKNEKTEEVPDPEPLIVPGYNLPDNIFNQGKPFYLEKDPVTGSINFNAKSKLQEDYDYADDIYDKSSIDRKDGPISGGHKPSDINQLTPNFHDFLNLPVKYNPDKYVYPLISSSYANTKVQGNINKHHNHKNYVVTTYKPTLSPTYLTTRSFHIQDKVIEFSGGSTPISSTPSPPSMPTTRRAVENLMNNAMNLPSFNEEFHMKSEPSTTLRTATTPSTTTKRAMSLFEQLFGSDYDDMEMTDSSEIVTSTTVTPITAKTYKPLLNDHPPSKGHVEQLHNLPKKPMPHPNVFTGSKMSDMNANYDYEQENPAQVAEIPQIIRRIPNGSLPSVPAMIPAAKPDDDLNDYDYDYMDKTTSSEASPITSSLPTTARPTSSITKSSSSFVSSTEGIKITSLPLGENHIQHLSINNRPIIVTNQNLRDQLNVEKIGYVHPQAPSTSSIHIPPDQDTVSFVMGNHQNVEGVAGNNSIKLGSPGTYIGSSLKESPYESNPFRPVYSQPVEEFQLKTGYQVHGNINFTKPYQTYSAQSLATHNGGVTGTVTIQPTKNNEASLTIGNQIALKPGHVVDEKIEDLEYTKGSKIVFPDSTDKSTPFSPDLNPPSAPHPGPTSGLPIGVSPQGLPPKEVLKLSSKPIFHQLPTELTPPENVAKVSQRVRPPWDPRPGHFHSGRPEYARPPRPQDVYKRVDNLPNILPQFRPNMPTKPVYHHHHHHHHSHPHPHLHGPHPHFERNQPHPHLQHSQQTGPVHGNKNYARQPLLERPSNNRPIGFFEKLHHASSAQSKIPSKVAEERIGPKPNLGLGSGNAQSQPPVQHIPPMQEHFAYLQEPPKVTLSNRKNGEDPETLQMIQVKQDNKEKPTFKQKLNIKDNLIKESHKEIISPKTPGSNMNDKPIYVVYPVNSKPMKLDSSIDGTKKASVVIGTRAELPLAPSNIKPSPNPSTSIVTELDFKYEVKDRHDSPILKPRPATFPIKSDFPYPMERPMPPIAASDVENKLPDDPIMISSNQWNIIDDAEPRIVNQNANTAQVNNNQISATLKTFTEKPIAVAYTPTESSIYSIPNYAGLVIPEMRDSEIAVSAVMHHSQPTVVAHHRAQIKAQINDEVGEPQPQQEFQAPFQASAHIDHSLSQGWAVLREKDERNNEISTQPLHTTSEFDIENFKPQLEGGFKPIYSYPEDGQDAKRDDKDVVINERQE